MPIMQIPIFSISPELLKEIGPESEAHLLTVGLDVVAKFEPSSMRVLFWSGCGGSVLRSFFCLWPCCKVHPTLATHVVMQFCGMTDLTGRLHRRIEDMAFHTACGSSFLTTSDSRARIGRHGIEISFLITNRVSGYIGSQVGVKQDQQQFCSKVRTGLAINTAKANYFEMTHNTGRVDKSCCK